MKKYWIILIVIISSVQLQAQNYDLAIGLRGGIPGGLTVKQLLDGGRFGLEGIVGLDYNRNATIVGLFEVQNYINRSSNWYFGFGGSLIASGNDLDFGFDGIIGYELAFDNYPLNVSLDLKPSYIVFKQEFAWYHAALSIRYIVR